MIPKKSRLLRRSFQNERHHHHKEPSPDKKGHLGLTVGSHHRDGLSGITLNSEEQEQAEVLVEPLKRNGHQQEGVMHLRVFVPIS